MDSYRIIMMPDAEEDMKELRSYIADVLSVRKTALAYVQAVRKEICSLTELPARYKLVDEGVPPILSDFAVVDDSFLLSFCVRERCRRAAPFVGDVCHNDFRLIDHILIPFGNGISFWY